MFENIVVEASSMEGAWYALANGGQLSVGMIGLLSPSSNLNKFIKNGLFSQSSTQSGYDQWHGSFNIGFFFFVFLNE